MAIQAVGTSKTTADNELERAAAKENFIDYQVEQVLRNSALRQSRPYAGSFQWGQRVAFWRDQKSRKAVDRRRQPGGGEVRGVR